MATIQRTPSSLVNIHTFQKHAQARATGGKAPPGLEQTLAAKRAASTTQQPNTATATASSQSGITGLAQLVQTILQFVMQLLSALTGGAGGAGSNTKAEADPSLDDGTGTGPQSPSLSDGSSSDWSDSSTGEATGQMWDVFFDRKSGGKIQQRSPVVLDLNGNGKADIGGSNITGNGKMEGKILEGFDLAPDDRQWGFNSVMRRPGKGAPKLPKGTVMKVFDANGTLVSQKPASNSGKSADTYGLKSGQRAEFWSPEGRLVGELKSAKPKKGAERLMYHWDNRNQNEWMKAWEGGKGDGLLVWDTDKDGKITSGKELFGEFDVDGKKQYQNGYQKLARHFDTDRDGIVRGDELKGLQIWEDRNGDGITQDGELVELSKYGITSLDVTNADTPNADMSSTYKFTKQ